MNRLIAALTLGATVFVGFASMARADEVIVEHHPVRREVVVVHPRHHYYHRREVVVHPHAELIVR